MRLLDPVLFRDGQPVRRLNWLNSDDAAPVIAEHVGHFALHERFSDGSHLLVRDLLGVHKLFFAIDRDTVVSSTYLIDLLRAGFPFDEVFSVPSGHFVRVHPIDERYELVRWGRVRFESENRDAGPGRSLTQFAASIRAALDRTFRMLARRFKGRPIYVTLSGGLDSTTIAALADEHFGEVRAITFALVGERQAAPGADLHFARRVAADFGIGLVEVVVEPEDVLTLLDEVLVRGQDHREFNVQCALVNAALGRAIDALHPRGPRPVVLSGDAMNELMADYAPVEFQGREYFGLPSIERARIRRFLVGGLDSGDREVGVFASYGVETIQPYALCAQEYADLPASLACESDSKSRLVRAVMDGRIPEYVLARPKVRAQVAVDGEPAGTLALLAGRGIDQAHLTARFAELFGIGSGLVRDLTKAGFYRFSACFPARSASRGR